MTKTCWIQFKRITKSNVFQFPPIKQILRFSDPTKSNQEKANEIFKMYFEELNPSAFLNNNTPRWKLASINPSVISSYIGNYTFSGAVGAVFNFNHFKIHDSWKSKYYMKLADKWISEKTNQMTLDRFKCLLIESIRILGIDHFHYAGDNKYNANPAKMMRINSSDRTVKKMAAEIPRLQISKMISVKNSFVKNKLWEKFEEHTLLQAVIKYGERKWAQIIKCTYQLGNHLS